MGAGEAGRSPSSVPNNPTEDRLGHARSCRMATATHPDGHTGRLRMRLWGSDTAVDGTESPHRCETPSPPTPVKTAPHCALHVVD